MLRLPRSAAAGTRRFFASSSTTATDGIDRSEGDVNLSSLRAKYQEKHLTAPIKKILDEDAKYFLHQAVSTPCLSALQGSAGCFLQEYDTGRQLFDFHGNSVHQIGFGHPEVVKAITEQMHSLPFCPRRYTNEPAVALAKKLTSLAPGALSRVLLCPGGGSAVGIALKLARHHTKKHKTISMWQSFHGAGLDTISIGGEALFRKNAGPLLAGAHLVPPPDEYRCQFRCHERGGCDLSCADLIEYTLAQENGDVAAVIAEPVRWTPYVPRKEFWEQIRASCDRWGALLVFDEIPNSMGRTGTFFTCENYVVPDILCLGKGLGGGILPLAAVIAKEELNEICKETALGHYTHEKNPVLCAAALATIRVIEREKLAERALRLGDYALKRLQTIKKKYPQLVGDARGIGLLLGLELVKCPETRERALEEAEIVMYKCLAKGLSFKLTMGNIVTLCPPLVVGEEELGRALDILEESVGEVVAGDWEV